MNREIELQDFADAFDIDLIVSIINTHHQQDFGLDYIKDNFNWIAFSLKNFHCYNYVLITHLNFGIHLKYELSNDYAMKLSEPQIFLHLINKIKIF